MKPNTLKKSAPKGRLKLAEALNRLLSEKDFNSITTAEISKVAGANEALIYRYFGDKRGLLHAVLDENLEAFLSSVIHDLKGIEGPINKLRKLIWSSIHFYANHRVFTKILLLEVRNHPGYFTSSTYTVVRQYTDLMLDLIKEGIKSGEIREELKPGHLRQIILGGIEHLILQAVVYKKDIDVDALHGQLCDTLFNGFCVKT